MQALLYFDHWWWIVIPGILLGLYAQFRLTSTYGHYSRVGNSYGLTGERAARAILDSAGLHNMPVREVSGHLTDHYDPLKRALFLSSENFHGRSLAAVGVAAHEAGHALQHKAAYAPLHLRMALVPVTRFATTAAMWLWVGALFFGLTKLLTIGIVAYALIALFQLITLPVEYDASHRAKNQLLSLGLIDPNERTGISRVLNAAALTYVAALVAALLDLLHLIMIARDRD